MTESTRYADRTVLCCRALVEGERGASAANLRDALKILQPSLGRAALDEARELLLRDLVFDGSLLPDGRRYVLADAAAAALRSQLGLPTGPLPKWTKLRDVWLLAQAIGLHPPTGSDLDRFAKAPGCRAAVVAAAHRLELRAYPTASEVLDALAWNRLEELTGSPVGDWRRHAVGTGKLVSFLLLEPLGLHTPRTGAQMLSILAKTAVDAVGDRLPLLRATILQRWRARGPLRAPTPTAPSSTAPAVPTGASENLLDELHTALRDSPHVRRTDGAVFVADAWAALQRRDASRTGDLEGFKQDLLAAARRGDVRLIRADLVESMDPASVARSEIRDLHARFHLLVLSPESR